VHTTLACVALALATVQCTSNATTAGTPAAQPARVKDRDAAIAAWQVVYGVLQHPRCLNCHPAGDAPLQGDESLPHAQNVQRGTDGHGYYAMRCETCHSTRNAPGAHLPPGAPTWHLPPPEEPMVFEGRSSRDLCVQLRDPAHNGGKTPQQLFDHMASDPLVGWGWDPGIGRTPVPVARDAVAQAMRTWLENGCECP
jgi:hypothetical protein